ncbi:E3 ubiquitin-protein ligase TRIM71 [Nematostella vectensis]|uniref:E3 ubiquitin-protein ligase TRIM71 n=1 Tax=Nematostella vectensis TaxID=45351 RepID=UPI00207768F7|nr:E3 ubiquitin-protein ligase TRIM71 [Nematostella vectensis]
METLLPYLREKCKCSLCSEVLTEPKILRCFHVYCQKCLQAETNEAGEKSKILKCPCCLEKTETANGEANYSILHSRFLEVLSIMESNTSGKECDIKCACKNRLIAIAHCFDCSRYFCENCLEAHNKINDEHRTVHFAGFQEGDYYGILQRQSFCERPNHGKGLLSFYCGTCKRSVCQCCITTEQQNTAHEISGLDSKGEALKYILQGTLDILKIKRKEEKKKNKLLEEIISKVKIDAEEAKGKVATAGENLISFITENVVELMAEIDNEVDQVIRKKTQQEHLLLQTEKAVDFISELAAFGSPQIMLSTMEFVHERYKELIALQTDLDDMSHRIKFMQSEGSRKLKEQGLGSLIDPINSIIHVEPPLEALSPVHLSVFCKHVNDLSSVFEDVVDVKISPVEDVKLLLVSDRKGEKYAVEFTPKVPQKYIAEVTINGEHVSNSPLELEVKPQHLRIIAEYELQGLTEPLGNSWGIAVNKSNTMIAVTFWDSHITAVFAIDGTFLRAFGKQGSPSEQLNNPTGVAFLNDDYVVVADETNHRISIFESTSGKCLKTIGEKGQGNGEFSAPDGVHVDEQGLIVVSDYMNNRVQVFSGDGTYQFQFGLGDEFEETIHPVCAISHGDTFIVSDYGNDVIHVFDKQEGAVTRRCVIGKQGSGDGDLWCPWGLAVDNDGNILVCDMNNYRIEKFTLDGRFVGKTTENIGQPIFLAVLTDGRIIVMDDKSKRMLHIH